MSPLSAVKVLLPLFSGIQVVTPQFTGVDLHCNYTSRCEGLLGFSDCKNNNCQCRAGFYLGIQSDRVFCKTCPNYGEMCLGVNCCKNPFYLACIGGFCRCKDDPSKDQCVHFETSTQILIAAKLGLLGVILLSFTIFLMVLRRSCMREEAVFERPFHRRDRLYSSLNSIQKFFLAKMQDLPPPYDELESSDKGLPAYSSSSSASPDGFVHFEAPPPYSISSNSHLPNEFQGVTNPVFFDSESSSHETLANILPITLRRSSPKNPQSTSNELINRPTDSGESPPHHMEPALPASGLPNSSNDSFLNQPDSISESTSQSQVVVEVQIEPKPSDADYGEELRNPGTSGELYVSRTSTGIPVPGASCISCKSDITCAPDDPGSLCDPNTFGMSSNPVFSPASDISNSFSPCRAFDVSGASNADCGSSSPSTGESSDVLAIPSTYGIPETSGVSYASDVPSPSDVSSVHSDPDVPKKPVSSFSSEVDSVQLNQNVSNASGFSILENHSSEKVEMVSEDFPQPELAVSPKPSHLESGISKITNPFTRFSMSKRRASTFSSNSSKSDSSKLDSMPCSCDHYSCEQEDDSLELLSNMCQPGLDTPASEIIQRNVTGINGQLSK